MYIVFNLTLQDSTKLDNMNNPNKYEKQDDGKENFGYD